MEFTMQRRDTLTLALILTSLVVSTALWWQTRRDLGALRTAQRQLSADVAALRNAPVIDVAGAPSLGRDDVVVTLVEFSDYECPFCIRHFSETMPQIAALVDQGKLRYVFRDFPIASLHPEAARAHQAARCAQDQNRFWQLHARLFSPAKTHTDPALEAHAVAAGLDVGQFRACLASGRHADHVQASVQQAVDLGANGTPSFFLGVRDRATDRVEVLHTISGAQPFSVFEDAIAAVAARIAP